MIYVVGIPRAARLPVKIGTSENVASRLLALQRGESMPWAISQIIRDPALLDVLASFPGDRGLEGRVHAALRDQRIDGEWFRLGSSTDAVTRVDEVLRDCSAPTLFSVDASRRPASKRTGRPNAHRGPRGAVDGGQFRPNEEKVAAALAAWSGEPDDDPFREFSRDQLRAVAQSRGLLAGQRRGLSRNWMVAALIADLQGAIIPPRPATSEGSLLEGARRDRERFKAWLQAGFTEDQALRLLAACSETDRR